MSSSPSLSGGPAWLWAIGEILLGIASLGFSVFMGFMWYRLAGQLFGAIFTSGSSIGNQPAWHPRQIWCRHRGGFVTGRTRTGRHTRFCYRCGKDLHDSVQQELRP